MTARDLKELFNSLPAAALDKEVIMHTSISMGDTCPETYTTPVNMYVLGLDQYFPFDDKICGMGMLNEEDFNNLPPEDKAACSYAKVFDKYQVVIFSDKLALREPSEPEQTLKTA